MPAAERNLKLRNPISNQAFHLFHLKASDLFTGVLFIYFVHVTVQQPSYFPLYLSYEPHFLCWDHTVAGMKTFELRPPPLFPYQFSRLPLLPRTLSNILDFHGRYDTVFPSLSSTVDSRQLKPSGKSRSKVNGTTSASRKLSRPPPQIPPHLRRPCANLLTKLVSRYWIRIRFFLSSPLKYS